MVLERREVEKRIYGSSEIAARTPVLTAFPNERKRLTASACLSDNSIIDPFEHVITELKTKIDFFVNGSSECGKPGVCVISPWLRGTPG